VSEWLQQTTTMPGTAGSLDSGQAAAIAALSGDRPLVVVEGAAGAGKTTTLATARQALEVRGRRLMVVTRTLKAARVAAGEVGAAAGSAAWLAFQHGWRWDAHGTWTRLSIGQPDPTTGVMFAGPAKRAWLGTGDLLVVDEAGMLDQDTARALFTVADETGARVALLGDRHQLPAVGRGGVLDIAVRAVGPAGCLTLDTVYRFTRTVTTPGGGRQVVANREYADLTLAMRTGADPGAVFDALAARGQIQLHPSTHALREALAATIASDGGEGAAVVLDTREQAAALGAAIRDRLIAEGRVDDTRVATTRAGQRIGAGDRIATRRNDHDLDVANRDTWTVTAVGRNGALLVAGAAGQARVLPATYMAEHVELAYASTAHGAQGETVDVAHLVIGEHTGAAAAYVGMTRGRAANTAHLVAADLVEARKQWLAVFARDRADLGPAHAAGLAAREAVRYAEPRPLEQALTEVRKAWTVEQRCLDRLALLEPRLAVLREVPAIHADKSSRQTPDPAGRLVEREVAATKAELNVARERISRLAAEPALLAQPADRLARERDAWRAGSGVHQGGVRRPR
jgi:exodeoxyribonuclease V alpha subunit